MSDSPRSVKKISITNQKGGVGKTTTSVNLAACLAAGGHKTLLIDLDPQGNASSGLGIDRFVSSTVYDVLIGKIGLNDAMQSSPLENLKVIPANQNLIGAEVELINAISRERKLKNALKELSDDFSFVIFDCPPSLGLLTINAFTASDSIMIPLQCEYYAMEGLGQLLNTYQIVKDDLNEDLYIEGIILTMFDPRNKLTHEVVKEMEGHFGNELYQTRIPRNVKLSEAPSFGKPVILYDIDSKGGQAYLDLAKEFLERNGFPTPDWAEFIKEQRAALKGQSAPIQEEASNIPESEEVSEPREKTNVEILVDENSVVETALAGEESLDARKEELTWKSPHAIELISKIPVETIELRGE